MAQQDIEVTVGTTTINVTIEATAAFRAFVSADNKIFLNGNGGDTYLIYNSTTAKVELYVGGVKKAAWG